MSHPPSPKNCSRNLFSLLLCYFLGGCSLQFEKPIAYEAPGTVDTNLAGFWDVFDSEGKPAPAWVYVSVKTDQTYEILYVETKTDGKLDVVWLDALPVELDGAKFLNLRAKTKELESALADYGLIRYRPHGDLVEVCALRQEPFEKAVREKTLRGTYAAGTIRELVRITAEPSELIAFLRGPTGGELFEHTLQLRRRPPQPAPK